VVKIHSITKVESGWSVGFSDGEMIGSRICSDPMEILQFLVENGFHMDKISYDFGQSKGEFSELVTVVGNPRGWRENSLINDDAPHIDIETILSYYPLI